MRNLSTDDQDSWSMALRWWLRKSVIRMGILYRIKFRLINVPFVLVCLGCALFSSACAHHDDDSSADSPQHRGHRHGGNVDRSNGFGSQSPVPGL